MVQFNDAKWVPTNKRELVDVLYNTLGKRRYDTIRDTFQP